MKILYVSASNAIGGAELSLFEIIQYFKQNGNEVYLALPPSERDDYLNKLRPCCNEIKTVRFMKWIYKNSNEENLRERIINYLYHIYLSGWFIWPALKLAFYIRKHKIDIVHTNSSAVIEGALAAKLSGRPHVWHIREAIGYSKHAIVQYPLQRIPKLYQALMNLLSNIFITNSKFTLDIVQPYLPAKKTFMIYNALSEKYFHYRNDILKNVIIKVGTVANLTAQIKNHIFVLQTAQSFLRHHPEIHIEFHLFGYIPEKNDPYLLKLVQFIKEAKIEQQIFLRGNIEPEIIYNEIDILIHPATIEAFGRIYIEAMASGIPVVAVKEGAAPELISDEETGFLIDKNNPEEAAKAIHLLITENMIAEKIRRNAYEFASANFRIRRLGQTLTEIYTQLLQSGKYKS